MDASTFSIRSSRQAQNVAFLKLGQVLGLLLHLSPSHLVLQLRQAVLLLRRSCRFVAGRLCR